MNRSRLATVKDIYSVTKLRLEYLKEAYGGLNEVQYRTLLNNNINYLEKHLNRDCFVSLIEINNEVISCAYMNILKKAANLRFSNGIYAEIYGVYTIKDYRNQQCATENMITLLKQAKREDASFVELEATEDGFGVYKRIGFCPIELGYTKMKYCYEKDL